MCIVIKLKREDWSERMLDEVRKAFPSIKSNKQLIEVLLCVAYLKFVKHSSLLASDTNNLRDSLLLIEPKRLINCVKRMLSQK